MGDNHLNKCKDCTKGDVRIRSRLNDSVRAESGIACKCKPTGCSCFRNPQPFLSSMQTASTGRGEPPWPRGVGANTKYCDADQWFLATRRSDWGHHRDCGIVASPT